MKKTKLLVISALACSLAACGENDCTSKDVHETLLALIVGDASSVERKVEGIFGGSTSAIAEEALLNASVSNIVTLSKDSDLGSYLCKANIGVELPDGKVLSHEISYAISRVESGDSEFEVSADQRDITKIRFSVNRPINRELGNQAEIQRKNDRVASFKSSPPIPISDADALTEIKSVLRDEMPGEFDESQFAAIAIDLNSDGYKEYVAIWNDVSSSNGPYWKLKQFLQHANAPGEQAKLRYSLENYSLIGNKNSVEHYEIEGDTLTLSDGAGWSESHKLLSTNIGDF